MAKATSTMSAIKPSKTLPIAPMKSLPKAKVKVVRMVPMKKLPNK